MAVRKLSKELQEIAVKELNEDPKRVEDDIAYIKNWLSQQSYITARTDDQLLLSFLRGSKFSLERTKEKIDMYYTVKSITPEIFDNRDPLLPEIQEILDLGVFLPLPKLEGPPAPRANLLRTGCYDPSKISMANIFKVSSMIQDILILEDDDYIIAGLYVVQDMKGLGMSHILSTSPILVKKAVVCFQQAYPNRIKGLQFFNTSSVFEAANKLFTPFLSEKLKNRMHVYPNNHLDELYQTIPKRILPEEYGGDGGKLADLAAYWKNKVESYREWFLDDAKYRTIEKNRPGKPKTSESIFGVDGSFRQLALD